MRTTKRVRVGRGALCALVVLAVALPAVAADRSTGAFVGMAEKGPLDAPVLVDSYLDFVATFGAGTDGLALPYLAPAVAAYFNHGGALLYVVRVAGADDASLIGSVVAGTGLQALSGVDDVSFVAIPGAGSPAVQLSLIAHCEQMGDRMAILDSASPDDLVAVQAQRTALASDDGFAALYFPWVVGWYEGSERLLPPSGFAAGLYAGHEPPDSPVGVLSGVTGVAYPVSSAEQEVLNPLGINCVRDLSGVRVWGARTLASNPELVYVAVRRMHSYLSEAVAELTQWCLTEPNDATTWSLVEAQADGLLYNHWVQNWFQGATPSDAYFAQCGLGRTMTQNDIDEGRIILRFGFAPLQPAEFVLVTVVHDPSAVSSVPAAGSAPFSFEPAGPNPFNPRTSVAFTQAAAGPVAVTIHDVRGRQVRRLHAGPLAAGRHVLSWDGRSDQGGELPSGLYLARAAAGGEVRTLKLVLVR